MNLSKHDNDMTKSCASNTPASQANVTSSISPQPVKQSRKGIKIKKFENIRPGAVMPDNIWLSNHMSCSRMSTDGMHTILAQKGNCANSKLEFVLYNHLNIY